MTQTVPSLPASPRAIYLEHLRSGRLAYQRAPDGRAVFYPRVAQPGTGSTQLEWAFSRGLGTVHATTAMHQRNAQPLNLALIDMDEGFRIMSRVEGLPAEQVRIGLRVRFQAVVEGGDVEPYPVFHPHGENGHA